MLGTFNILGDTELFRIYRLAEQSLDCTHESEQEQIKTDPPKMDQEKQSKIISIENCADLD